MSRGAIIVFFLSLLFESSLTQSPKCVKDTDCPIENQDVFSSSTTESQASWDHLWQRFSLWIARLKQSPEQPLLKTRSLKGGVHEHQHDICWAGAFEGLVDLKVIEISSTPLTSIPVGVFKDLSKCEVMSFEYLSWTWLQSSRVTEDIEKHPQAEWKYSPVTS